MILLIIPISHLGAEELRARMGLFMGLHNKECNPCTLSPGGEQKDFKISYSMRKQDSKYIVDINLDDNSFNLEVDESVIVDSILPFRRCRFFREHSLRLYGLQESEPASNSFYHYFVRDQNNGRFHYIGRCGDLTYNDESQTFSVLEAGGTQGPRLSYYKLEGNRFKCHNGLCKDKTLPSTCGSR